MPAKTTFYIQTPDTQKVEKTLLQFIKGAKFSLKHEQAYEDWPNKWKQEGGSPEFMAIGKGQEDWVTVTHNSFDKLEYWGAYLSELFDSLVMITFAQSVSMITYLAVYQSGKLRKETGELNWNDITTYAHQHNLQMEFEYAEVLWTTIDLEPEGGQTIGEIQRDMWNRLVKPRPWWKVW